MDPAPLATVILPASKYPIPEQLFQDIENRFRYHPPINDQAARYIRIREAAGRLAILIAGETPKSREQSLALTLLQESTMWANAAIACNEQ